MRSQKAGDHACHHNVAPQCHCRSFQLAPFVTHADVLRRKIALTSVERVD
jgi:hypothetical protein